MIIDLIEQAVSKGACLHKAADILGLSSRTIIRWRRQDDSCDRRNGPKSPPANKLSEQDRQKIVDVANCPEFRDLSPKQIVPKLADQGVYIASELSFYRVLREHKMINHRLRSKPPVHNRPKEFVATGPCQVWTWDITYLRSTIRGSFFYLYMFIDVWSRKIVAATVFDEESMEHSASLFNQTCMVHGIDPRSLVLHSDNGGPMKGSTMMATLQRLGVIPSFSRPRVSDDNPYSESLFRTLKYRPNFPSGAFETIEHAQVWVDDFVRWYNTEHLHSSIRFVTPDDRHYGREKAILANRNRVYEQARDLHPNRWSKNTRNWDPVKIVYLNPDDQTRADLDLDNREAA
jgi:putative transposase